jgi:uncharacterized membrane protein
MPRETDTSLFTSRVTQGLLFMFCCVGLVLIVFVFMQNYKSWIERKQQAYQTNQEREERRKAANRDFLNSLLVLLICKLFLIFLLVMVGIDFFS